MRGTADLSMVVRMLLVGVNLDFVKVWDDMAMKR